MRDQLRIFRLACLNERSVKLESKIMNTTSYIVCLFLLFGAATRVFGLAGELKEPGLAFPEGFSESARTNIMASLRRPDCTFLGGHFINSFTSLKYGGETLALNLFLEGLAKCPGVRPFSPLSERGHP